MFAVFLKQRTNRRSSAACWNSRKWLTSSLLFWIFDLLLYNAASWLKGLNAHYENMNIHPTNSRIVLWLSHCRFLKGRLSMSVWSYEPGRWWGRFLVGIPSIMQDNLWETRLYTQSYTVVAKESGGNWVKLHAIKLLTAFGICAEYWYEQVLLTIQPPCSSVLLMKLHHKATVLHHMVVGFPFSLNSHALFLGYSYLWIPSD